MDNDSTRRALELFSMHYNCAQSVFAACASKAALPEEQCLALAAAFGGGIARQGQVCGALTGALMALGEAASAELANDPFAGREILYKRAQEFTQAFRKAHGSILCRELTGCQLNTGEGQRTYKELEMHRKLCQELVTFAAGEASKVIAASQKPQP
jgi:C_GCAxxG_C_C family probable redox protein